MINNMETLLENWRLRMVNYREEADNTTSHIIRLKAMSKFLILRDCIKEVEEEVKTCFIPAVCDHDWKSCEHEPISEFDKCTKCGKIR